MSATEPSLDDRQRGEATRSWQEAQSGKVNEQERQDIDAEKPSAPPVPTLEFPAPTLGMTTRAVEDKQLASDYTKLVDQQAEKFADNRQSDLVASKEKDYEAEHGRLGAAFEQARDEGMEK